MGPRWCHLAREGTRQVTGPVRPGLGGCVGRWAAAFSIAAGERQRLLGHPSQREEGLVPALKVWHLWGPGVHGRGVGLGESPPASDLASVLTNAWSWASVSPL